MTLRQQNWEIAEQTSGVSGHRAQGNVPHQQPGFIPFGARGSHSTGSGHNGQHPANVQFGLLRAQAQGGQCPRRHHVHGQTERCSGRHGSRCSRFFKDTPGYEAEAKELWEHAVGTALMSQILAKKILKREDPQLFTAALLHDIGKIILGEFVSEKYHEIKNSMSVRSCSFLEAEEEVLGMNHAGIGGVITAAWHFPRISSKPSLIIIGRISIRRPQALCLG